MASTPITLLALAEYVGPGTGAAVDTTDFSTARLTLTVTKCSDRPGSPPAPPDLPLDAPATFDVRIETSIDGLSNWREVLCAPDRHTRANVRFDLHPWIRSERRIFPAIDKFLRVRWNIAGGRGKATFSVSGDVV